MGARLTTSPVGRVAGWSAGRDDTAGFHLSFALSLGLKIPKWTAPGACLLRGAWAILDTGTGAKFKIYVRGVAPASMTDSPAVAAGAATYHGFTPILLAAGDWVQANVTNVGTVGAADLSITLDIT